ncbi:MAG: hypothetical protein QGI46_10790 [Planctomycetota bacterium]|nr:hypothetical protein [Planctomycetota bacterium]
MLPTCWASVSALAFEREVSRLAPAGGALERADLALLAKVLEAGDGRSVRAAVLLARSRDPLAARALLERLEQRARAPTRHGDAGDVVAAAALAESELEAGALERLTALAVGPRPHPDIEVRVECAASALSAGREEVIEFLLAVLASQTPDQTLHPPDWETKRTMAWAKHRAARALSARAGVPCTFRPDGSYEQQRADRLQLRSLLYWDGHCP